MKTKLIGSFVLTFAPILGALIVVLAIYLTG